MLLLAIESSCDDTAVSVLKDGIPLSNIVSSQMVHSGYGGVVPEMASREHQKNIWIVTEKAIQHSGINKKELDAIAFTKGPGLPGSLMVGASFAKGLAMALDKPLIAVNHMEAHILSLLIKEPMPSFPFLCLVVSGGHTMLVLVKQWNEMTVIGSTKDDAVGEAFDKCAKIMGLGYPGGKIIDDLAKSGNEKAFPFPVAKVEKYRFSYSGVKTSFLYFLQSKTTEFIRENQSDICSSLQFALLKPLVDACELAMEEYGIKELGLAGGVAANSSLRKRLQALCDQKEGRVYFPDFEYCTDNAAMIGRAACFKWEQKDFCGLDETTEPRLAIGS
ncbi:MAG TPA: tRNA (adenosine(37)-N6)-threonylcarbamoyltransferase complex transferase subunit TsaD [Catalimonadaceae bacterium]|nr:tRNA (adenosine(37)-N6)-threonylcarbamoyltransferase complex transferase subunit TsaD [Catalimonadaceae bacterium]HPI11287.1 tRNA (adenosine(37)-N6)-threonylcarbamoyltransferase complex transferase subunit TsaD [Catalimonadaceae bacterium]